MKFRNYCIVVMGDTEGVILEIEKVSENKPNFLDAKGILVATFSSVVSPSELNDWFKMNQRSFLVFDLSPENSGFHITKKIIHDGLFGFLDTTNNDVKSAELLRAIKMSSETKNRNTSVKKNNKNKIVKTKKTKQITEKDISNMTSEEKGKLMSEILDKGVKNLTEYDKNILTFLAK